jgi:hypothetical protein
LINNLGVVTGKSLGLSQSASLAIGSAFSHFAGIADVLSGNAAAFLMVCSPIKSFIEGCDPRLLPKKLVELNKHGMPERSMWGCKQSSYLFHLVAMQRVNSTRS